MTGGDVVSSPWAGGNGPEPIQPWRSEIQPLDEIIRDAFLRVAAAPPIPEKHLVRSTSNLVEALVRAEQYGCDMRGRFAGPALLTRRQCEQLTRESGSELPDDWEDRAQVGAEVGVVLGGVPVELVAEVEESTPWAFGWRP